MTNPWIDTHNADEQDVLEDLIDEAIAIHGETFYYIPRSISDSDGLNIFNEDTNSIFEHSYPFTGYLENPTSGLEGNGYMLQKFGGVIDYNATITVSKREWNKEVGFHGTTPIPDSPASGDLIYYPLTSQLFEIKFVDDKTNPFAQLGSFYSYRLTIELFQYSSQRINTGIQEIDKFETLNTFDVDASNSLWGGIQDIEIIDRGSGYQQPPEIVVDSLTGSQASFEVTLTDDGGLKSVKVLDPGFGYHSDDVGYVIGNCSSKAKIKPIINTIVENVHDGYGNNTPDFEKATQLTNITKANRKFGGLNSNNIKSLNDNFGLNEF